MICLFCKQEREESDEHVFATPFGEVNFVVRFVCKQCNDRLGNEVDHRADRDARLSHARHSAGLPIRPQSIRSVDAAIEADGNQLRTVFDKRELASVIAPQPDGDQMVVGRDLMPRTIREMLRAKFRRAREPISDAEVDGFTAEVLRKFDAANTGDTVTHSYKGLTIHVPRLEAQNDTAGVRRYDDRDAIHRVSGKIAFEIAAYATGVELLLRDRYDAFRSWILTGDPDLGPTVVEVVRAPVPDGGDAERQHTVRLDEQNGALHAVISYYGAYVVRVKVGEAVGLTEPWARRFPIEDTGGGRDRN